MTSPEAAADSDPLVNFRGRPRQQVYPAPAEIGLSGVDLVSARGAGVDLASAVAGGSRGRPGVRPGSRGRAEFRERPHPVPVPSPQPPTPPAPGSVHNPTPPRPRCDSPRPAPPLSAHPPVEAAAGRPPPAPPPAGTRAAAFGRVGSFTVRRGLRPSARVRGAAAARRRGARGRHEAAGPRPSRAHRERQTRRHARTPTPHDGAPTPPLQAPPRHRRAYRPTRGTVPRPPRPDARILWRPLFPRPRAPAAAPAPAPALPSLSRPPPPIDGWGRPVLPHQTPRRQLQTIPDPAQAANRQLAQRRRRQGGEPADTEAVRAFGTQDESPSQRRGGRAGGGGGKLSAVPSPRSFPFGSRRALRFDGPPAVPPSFLAARPPAPAETAAGRAAEGVERGRNRGGSRAAGTGEGGRGSGQAGPPERADRETLAGPARATGPGVPWRAFGLPGARRPGAEAGPGQQVYPVRRPPGPPPAARPPGRPAAAAQTGLPPHRAPSRAVSGDPPPPPVPARPSPRPAYRARDPRGGKSRPPGPAGPLSCAGDTRPLRLAAPGPRTPRIGPETRAEESAKADRAGAGAPRARATGAPLSAPARRERPRRRRRKRKRRKIIGGPARAPPATPDGAAGPAPLFGVRERET
ncbi:basic proline-rich protein-like [Haemorhous mexicanus]|uniref:basic proline-rich protein-like n=1 Tax=Haemorhous mexicanus TaxID=30427 RepID=UPI0028BF1D48|nr:basic proline-rich protein-like [Haemorhous mexicanus]